MIHAATIGFFDGVHKGHRFLFNELRCVAADNWCEPLIVTFAEHPRSVLQQTPVPLLTTPDERRTLLEKEGKVLMLPFPDYRHLTAAEFLHFLRTQHNVRILLMGYDHRFGCDRLTDLEAYREAAMRESIAVERMPQYIETGLHISSTAVRNALRMGDTARAEQLLERPYELHGNVVHGKGLGRQLGFPTANLSLPEDKLIPREGVYAAQVSLPNDIEQPLPAILNIGTNPTVGDTRLSVEVHIPDFHADLYDKQLAVRVLRHLRDEQRFGDIAQLKQQIQNDIKLLQQ